MRAPLVRFTAQSEQSFEPKYTHPPDTAGVVYTADLQLPSVPFSINGPRNRQAVSPVISQQVVLQVGQHWVQEWVVGGLTARTLVLSATILLAPTDITACCHRSRCQWVR